LNLARPQVVAEQLRVLEVRELATSIEASQRRFEQAAWPPIPLLWAMPVAERMARLRVEAMGDLVAQMLRR
jgi:hypothetical protein